MPLFVPFLSLVSFAAAALTSGNLNYRSPSHSHPSLGISHQKVAKRHLNARQAPASSLNFTHGVASGDPYPDSVILWTRIAPMVDNDRSNITVSGYVPLYSHETALYVNASDSPVCVNYKVATDRAFSRIANQGTAYTTSDIDYTVKVRQPELWMVSETENIPGRSQQPPTLHSILLPVQRLQLQQHREPYRSNEDQPRSE